MYQLSLKTVKFVTFQSSSDGGTARVTSSSSPMEADGFNDDDIDSEEGGGRVAVLSLARSHHTLR